MINIKAGRAAVNKLIDLSNVCPLREGVVFSGPSVCLPSFRCEPPLWGLHVSFNGFPLKSLGFWSLHGLGCPKTVQSPSFWRGQKLSSPFTGVLQTGGSFIVCLKVCLALRTVVVGLIILFLAQVAVATKCNSCCYVPIFTGFPGKINRRIQSLCG